MRATEHPIADEQPDLASWVGGHGAHPDQQLQPLPPPILRLKSWGVGGRADLGGRCMRGLEEVASRRGVACAQELGGTPKVNSLCEFKRQMLFRIVCFVGFPR